MMYLVPFRSEHVAGMRLQTAQQGMSEFIKPDSLRELEGKHSVTLMLDGRPIASAGAVEIWSGRAYIWSFLSDDIPRKSFIEVNALAKQFVDGLPFRRLEAAVECGFEQGHRWVRCHGFFEEAPVMKAFQADGRDATLYARVKGA
jgi:hypothetical protein